MGRRRGRRGRRGVLIIAWRPNVAYTMLPSQSPGAHSQRPTESITMENGATSKPAQSKPGHERERQWAYISDTTVRLTTLEEVKSMPRHISAARYIALCISSRLYDS